MISDNPFFNRKINALAAFLIIFLISFVLAAFTIRQSRKLADLQKPLPLLIQLQQGE